MTDRESGQDSIGIHDVLEDGDKAMLSLLHNPFVEAFVGHFNETAQSSEEITRQTVRETIFRMFKGMILQDNNMSYRYGGLLRDFADAAAIPEKEVHDVIDEVLAIALTAPRLRRH